MTKRLLVFAALALPFTCCTSRKLINQDSGVVSYEEFNKVADGRKGRIVLLSGQEFDGFDIHIAPDSASYTDASKVLTWTCPTSQVKKMVFINRNQGAALGFGLGMLAGASFIYLVGISEGDSEEFSASEGAAIGAIIIGAPAGALIGTLVGAVKGNKKEYVFSYDGAH